MQRVKICPRCEAEYYPDVLECPDCGLPFVVEDDLENSAEG